MKKFVLEEKYLKILKAIVYKYIFIYFMIQFVYLETHDGTFSLRLTSLMIVYKLNTYDLKSSYRLYVIVLLVLLNNT